MPWDGSVGSFLDPITSLGKDGGSASSDSVCVLSIVVTDSSILVTELALQNQRKISIQVAKPTAEKARHQYTIQSSQNGFR